METTPLVGIVMGSDSDLPVMKTAAEILEELDVPYELSILSAHRTPARVEAYAKGAAGRGLRVIIAGAGGAAHLAGVIAAYTELPVIGVPVLGKAFGGADALYSIVQMPPGIPVATVGVNGAKNAGLLAVGILGVAEEAYRRKIRDYKSKLAQEVEAKAARLEADGWRAYLATMDQS
ncbi:MAG TPA: 5-(carboxyamino)imidazole ribonucleotide mutase [Firmicutes bacterium]|jgi:5-(carboxyamino)imidazole ribonucleotide mutase|nr:5-(carboxyamino)imidazole ribonucleotide mutase [Bacillota bacterium]